MKTRRVSSLVGAVALVLSITSRGFEMRGPLPDSARLVQFDFDI